MCIPFSKNHACWGVGSGHRRQILITQAGHVNWGSVVVHVRMRVGVFAAWLSLVGLRGGDSGDGESSNFAIARRVKFGYGT
jgi:hypothetical protein